MHVIDYILINFYNLVINDEAKDMQLSFSVLTLIKFNDKLNIYKNVCPSLLLLLM